MPLMEMLGFGPNAPDKSGLFGLFNDDTALRMQMAGNTIGGLSITNRNPQNNADLMVRMRAEEEKRKEKNKLYEAAQRYADKIRPSNPDLADAILAQPELIQTIHGEQIKNALDPQAQAFQTMLGVEPPSIAGFQGATAGAGAPNAPPPGAGMDYVPPMPPDPMFQPGGSMSEGSGPVPLETYPDPNAQTPVPVAPQDPMNAMLEKARATLGIPDLTMAEVKRMVAAGPQGFAAVWNQITDERNQAAKEQTRLTERKEDTDFRKEGREIEQAEFAASHELQKGNAGRSQKQWDMSFKLQQDQFSETLKQHEAEAARLKANAEQAQKNFETGRSDDAEKAAIAALAESDKANATLEEHKATRAMQLRDDLWTQTKGYKTVLDVGDRAIPLLEKAARGERLTGTDQIQIIYDLVKGLDSISSVREGEVVLAREAQSLMEQVTTWMTKTNNGALIDQGPAKEMLKKVIDFSKIAEKRDYIVTKKFEKDAKKFGINPELITTPEEEVDLSGFKSRFGSLALPPDTPGASGAPLVSPKF